MQSALKFSFERYCVDVEVFCLLIIMNSVSIQMFAMDQFMGMNTLFNNTGFITSDLPLRTGKSHYYLVLVISLPSVAFVCV